MLATILRVFGVVLCAFCLVGAAFAGTRIIVTAGGEFATDFPERSASSMAPNFKAVVDASSWLPKHLPLEVAFGFTGPYPAQDEWYVPVDNAFDYRPVGYYYHWQPRSRFSETVRYYFVGSMDSTHAPDGVELALGIGDHQVYSRQYDEYARLIGGYRVESQLRADLDVRAVFLPTQPSGPVFELNVQRGLQDTQVLDAGWTLLVSLGWRFRI